MNLVRHAVACALLAAAGLGAQTNPKNEAAERRAYFLANYTKYEYRISMRDGVRLFTTVYAPKDTSKTYPILYVRTPYSVAPYGEDNYRDWSVIDDGLWRPGFIFAYQDVRGRNRSEGEFVDVRPYIPVKKGPRDIDESSDAWDTIDWLVKNVANNNGKVGVWGISYPGFYAAMAALDAHPAVKAVSPQAPVSDWFIGDDWRHNGAFFLAHTFRFFVSFGRGHGEPGEVQPGEFDMGTPDGYDFFLRQGPLRNYKPEWFGKEIGFWRELQEHDRYDAYWKDRNVTHHLRNLRPAMLTVGGWFDAEDLWGALAVGQSVRELNPKQPGTLVMGPWIHGGWMGAEGDHLGAVTFASDTAKYYRDNVFTPFFLHHLKGEANPALPVAYMFETGRNQWRKFDSWPPKEAAEKTFYFQAGGKLATGQPAEGEACDEYVSDPAKPVPFMEGAHQGMATTYMVSDQRFASRRTDVLAYETEPLESNVSVAGPLECTLHVSTSATDSDFVVKLIDVYPADYPEGLGGYQQLVRGEPFRGRYRNGFDKPEAFQPGKAAKIAYKMPDVFHTFRRGHRIMVQVQSSWFPLVDRNPQKFVNIGQAAEGDFQKATQRVYRSRALPSGITMRVMER